MERGFIGLDVAVLAVSEATALGDEAPAQLVLDRLGIAGHRIVVRERIDDSVQLIKAKYLEWIADERIDVVIVTSGAKSEAASEALLPLITKRVDGFSDLFRFLTFSEIGTAAMLVDAAAGQCKQTFFFVLPASIGAVRTALDKLLLPQLDYRTKPHNLVMRMPRHHVGASEAETASPSKAPWIVPKDPSAPVVIAPRAATKRAGTEPGTPAALASSSVSQRIALSAIDRPEHVSVSQRMSAVIEAASAPIVPAPTRPRAPTPPPPVRTKVTTAKDNVPLKPPAQIITLSQLLTNAPGVEELPPSELKDITPAQLVDDDDDADLPAPPPEEVPVPVALRTKVPTGPIRIEDESTREAIVAAQRRAVTERVTPLDELPPRSVAIPAKRKRDKMVVALWAVIIVAAASLTVMLVITRQRDRRAQAMKQQAADTRVADLSPPAPPAPPEPVAVPVALVIDAEPAAPDAEPHEIDMTADVQATRVAANPVRPPTTPQPRAVQPVEKPDEPVEKPPVETPDPAVEPGCDEVSCVLDRYRLSCCAKFKPAEPATPPVHSGVPEKIDRAMVTAGISKVKPAVIQCGESAGVKGKVKVNVTVSPAGAVTDVTVAETPDPALGTCVANAVRKATFETTETGGSFGYPFVF